MICENFIGNSKGLINVGVEGRDQFGCQVTSFNTMPNHQFDCTNSGQPFCGTNYNNNHFNYVCIGDKDEVIGSRQFASLATLIKDRGLAQKHIILKIDCEGCEYPGFQSFPIADLDYIDMIVAEFHFDTISRETWGQLDIFRTIMTKFVNVNLHMNNFGCMSNNRKLRSRAIEVTLVNKKLITLYS